MPTNARLGNLPYLPQQVALAWLQVGSRRHLHRHGSHVVRDVSGIQHVKGVPQGRGQPAGRKSSAQNTRSLLGECQERMRVCLPLRRKHVLDTANQTLSCTYGYPVLL